MLQNFLFLIILNNSPCAQRHTGTVVISRSTSVTFANFQHHRFQAELYGPNMSALLKLHPSICSGA